MSHLAFLFYARLLAEEKVAMSKRVVLQFVDDLPKATARGLSFNRSVHIWKSHGLKWKCVLCGGITNHPTINGDVEKYEPLTPEERDLCPFIEVISD